MFKRILVPLDGSSLAEQALEPALRLAQQSHGIVFLLRVPVYADAGIPELAEYDLLWSQPDYAQAHEQSADYLRDIKQSKARPDISLRTIVGEGSRADAIVNTAVAHNIDLILMTTHARTGLTRMLLGSVAAEVLRHAPCPLLILRKPTTVAHILLALDGSALAEQGLQPTLALAGALCSNLTLLRVCESADAERGTSQAYLSQVPPQNEMLGFDITTATATGPVAPAIVNYAKEHAVDVIAMTTHGRSGLRRLIYGSITESVAAYPGCCAMLIVKSA